MNSAGSVELVGDDNERFWLDPNLPVGGCVLFEAEADIDDPGSSEPGSSEPTEAELAAAARQVDDLAQAVVADLGPEHDQAQPYERVQGLDRGALEAVAAHLALLVWNGRQRQAVAGAAPHTLADVEIGATVWVPLTRGRLVSRNGAYVEMTEPDLEEVLLRLASRRVTVLANGRLLMEEEFA